MHGAREKPAVVLIVDDSEADRHIIKKGLLQKPALCQTHELSDGAQLINYLKRESPFQDLDKFPMPDLVLLDINMPRIDGIQALKIIRQQLDMTSLPVIMLTTSSRDKDVLESYELGVNAFITKPVGAREFMEALSIIKRFWLELVSLPHEKSSLSV